MKTNELNQKCPTEFYLKIRALAEELGYKNSSELRKVLIAKEVLKRDPINKSYNLTPRAIKYGLGKVQYKAIAGGRWNAPYNIYFVDKMETFLKYNRSLKG
ncbi:MAG: hypothetical protein JXR07_07675 [Reichenbachiella sp.]